MKPKTTTTALAAAILAIAAPASAAEPAQPLCHGEPATHAGTGGGDVISDATEFLGANPVIVLGEGDDVVQVGVGFETLESLTVCAGPGNDGVEVQPGFGRPAEVLLDGGVGHDFVGYDGGSGRADLPPLRIIGGAGRDDLRGANADDALVGGRGRDRAFGVGGSDRLVGGEGADLLHGERGDDRLEGGRGADLLDGDPAAHPGGADFANGGANPDRCEAEVELECER